MSRPGPKLWLVESVSMLRILGALLFASIAFQDVPRTAIATFYLIAMSSDILDGYLARRLKTETYFGKVLDLVSDKSLTIVSLLYASARGVTLLPLALIAIRELLMIGARLVKCEDDAPLFPTSRVLGGSVAFLLWANTLLLAIDLGGEGAAARASIVYWIGAVVLNVNLAWRLHTNASRIKASLVAGP
jgi:phosphatidylglycerophosphate synthase